MAAAMAAFNGGEQRVARAHLRSVIDGGTPEAEEARYYYAVSFFREDNWARASREFKHLLGHHPDGRWVAAAHWHLGICDLRRGRTRRARARFEYIVRRFPHDAATVENARAELLRTGRRRGGLVGELWRRLHAPSG
jgi:TolA-binding protein